MSPMTARIIGQAAKKNVADAIARSITFLIVRITIWSVRMDAVIAEVPNIAMTIARIIGHRMNAGIVKAVRIVVMIARIQDSFILAEVKMVKTRTLNLRKVLLQMMIILLPMTMTTPHLPDRAVIQDLAVPQVAHLHRREKIISP